MFPVYSVTHLPGCSRSASVYGLPHAVKVELGGVGAHVPEALLQHCACILFRFDSTEVTRERAVVCADALELLRVRNKGRDLLPVPSAPGLRRSAPGATCASLAISKL